MPCRRPVNPLPPIGYLAIAYADQHNTTSVNGVKPVYRTTNAYRAAVEDMNKYRYRDGDILNYCERLLDSRVKKTRMSP